MTLDKRLKISFLACAILSGCSNNLLSTAAQLSYLAGIVSPTPTSTSTSKSKDSFIISTVTIQASSQGSTSGGTVPYTTNIFFDTSQSTAPVTNHCSSSTSSTNLVPKNCACSFSWSETNTQSGINLVIPRSVQTPITVVQPNLVSCSAPEVYGTEIPDGTQIVITIAADTNNIDAGQFTVNNYGYAKNTGVISGSFQDAQGHAFDNILHYACYQKTLRGPQIQNKVYTRSNPATGASKNILIGNQFCVTSSNNSGATPSTNCPNQGPPTASAQSYYYNLFIKSTQKGDINLYNDGFICPTVNESLGGSSLVGQGGQVWPLDQTFALSLGPTPSFSVGVQANTKLSNGQDPTAGNNSCFSTGSGGGGTSSGSNNSIINSCLGFAAAVNADGTCPSIIDSTGLIRQTFRLRRYVAIYPPYFDTGGQILQGKAQGIDTIYVLDRPVQAPSTANPLKPYTMRGPKPCPFAFFDRKGVTTSPLNSYPFTHYGPPSYIATNDPRWRGTNYDGLELPNLDTVLSSSNASCSATVPILSDPRNSSVAFSLTTVNITNDTVLSPNSLKHLWIRPVQPFTPHYEEDTDFQACAPQAVPLTDPPLHFARDASSGNVAWCAESYPTQNPNISSLDPIILPTPVPSTASGLVAPFTSHTVKNSRSTACAASAITIPTDNYSYPAASGGILPTGYARHSIRVPWEGTNSTDKTCDRTVSASQSRTWPLFPLLAPAADIERGISADSSYYCTLTYDNNGSKTNQLTPSSGCCSSQSVSVPTSRASSALGAHLEPDVPCKIPTY